VLRLVARGLGIKQKRGLVIKIGRRQQALLFMVFIESLARKKSKKLLKYNTKIFIMIKKKLCQKYFSNYFWGNLGR
jgi:hypothetical protein